MGPFTDFLKDNSPRLTAILGNMQLISKQIAEGQGTVGKLINDEARITSAISTISNMNNTAIEIQGMASDGKSAVVEAKKIVADISSGQGTLGKMLRDETLYRETTGAMTNLHQVLQETQQWPGPGRARSSTDETFFKNVKGTLQKVEKATDTLEDQGPISVIGTVVGHLF